MAFVTHSFEIAVVTMATDATGSIGRIDATAYPILDPENIIGKICPPRHPVFKQTAVMHNFKIPERSSIQKDKWLHSTTNSFN